MRGYQSDLASVHDQGFGQLATNGALQLIQLLPPDSNAHSRIVELGCGSGISSQILCDAGFDVVGYDLAPAMLKLARRRAPRAAFHCKSFLDARIPECMAVTALGEVLNYLFDERNSMAKVRSLFKSIYTALRPGGILLFDIATSERIERGTTIRNFTEVDDWACLYSATTNRDGSKLIRKVTTFRKSGRFFRRTQEIHRLRLMEERHVTAMLRDLHFTVRTTDGYAAFAFPRGLKGFIARRPKT